MGLLSNCGFKFKLRRYNTERYTAPHIQSMLAKARLLGGGGGRGLHSSTSQLNLSVFNRIGGARRGCVARVRGVLGGV